jgi:hypothetical protein
MIVTWHSPEASTSVMRFLLSVWPKFSSHNPRTLNAPELMPPPSSLNAVSHHPFGCYAG